MGQFVLSECTSAHLAEAHMHSFYRYFEALTVSILSITELVFLQKRNPSTRAIELIVTDGG